MDFTMQKLHTMLHVTGHCLLLADIQTQMSH